MKNDYYVVKKWRFANGLTIHIWTIIKYDDILYLNKINNKFEYFHGAQQVKNYQFQSSREAIAKLKQIFKVKKSIIHVRHPEFIVFQKI